MNIGKKLCLALVGVFMMAGIALVGFGGEARATAPQFDVDQPCDTAVLDSEFCEGNEGQGIFGILALVINILTGAIGVACTIGLVMSGIMWGTAAGDVGRVKMAQKRIIEIVTGMVVLALMWAFLNWLIPGGVFN